MPVLNSARSIDQFNQQLRANPEYQAFLRSMGVNTSGPIRLSDQQRKRAESWVRSRVGDIGKLEIDPAGNVNQNEGFGKQLKRWGPIAGGAAATLFGVPGLFPGLLSGGGAAAGGAAASGAAQGASGVLPSAAIPGLHAAVPGAIASQGISAGLGAAGAGAAGGALGAAAAGGASGAGGSIANRIFGGTAGDLIPAGLGIASLIRGLTQGRPPAEDRLNNILGIAENRVRAQEPLFQAITSMANAGLPRYARSGGAGSGATPPAPMPPGPTPTPPAPPNPDEPIDRDPLNLALQALMLRGR